MDFRLESTHRKNGVFSHVQLYKIWITFQFAVVNSVAIELYMAFLVNAMVKVVGNESSLKKIGTLPTMTSIKQPSTRFHLWWKMWCVISTIPKWVRFPQRSYFFWILPFFGPWKWLLFFHYSFITLTKTNINGIIKTAGLFNSSLRFLVSTYYRY